MRAVGMSGAGMSGRCSRRAALAGLGGLAALPLLTARPARASAPVRRFVYVMVPGGWDPTRALSPAFGHPLVRMESAARPGLAGAIPFVDHPGRPSVAAFFDENHHRAVILEGLLVPSVAHRTSTQLVLTGAAADGLPDWASLVAAESGDFTVPHVVIDGPSYPGGQSGSVVRTGAAGQLQGLLDGSLVDRLSPRPARLSPEVAALVAERARGRAEAAAGRALTPRDRALADGHADALARAQALRGAAGAIPWDTGGAFDGQVRLGAALLGAGLCRSVGLAFATERDWDSHYLNEERQHPLTEALFAGLRGLAQTLDRTLGPSGLPLSEDTVVVVISEMGRTPIENGSKGKDHWPWTPALLFGAGLRGDQVIGALDAGMAGVAIDPGSGAPDPAGVAPGPGHLGATLLQLAGLDPEAVLPGLPPLTCALA